ncbi:hypothetical protein MAUB1S_05043 [Mycolicibacterium aubagnense]
MCSTTGKVGNPHPWRTSGGACRGCGVCSNVWARVWWWTRVLMRRCCWCCITELERVKAAAAAQQARPAAAAEAKRIAYRLDQQAVLARARQARADRYVRLRPAGDGMATVSVRLPAAEGQVVHTALSDGAATTLASMPPGTSVPAGLGRTHGQIMADLVVERVTGRNPIDTPVSVTVNLVLSDETLLAGGAEPAYLQGMGRSRRSWPAPCCWRPRLIRRRRRRCGGCTPSPVATSWWRWSRQRGCFREGWRGSSRCAIRSAGPRSAMPGFGTPITSRLMVTVGAPRCTTVKACVSSAITSKQNRAGKPPRPMTGTAGTPSPLTTPTGAVYTSTAPPGPEALRIFTRDVYIARIHPAA